VDVITSGGGMFSFGKKKKTEPKPEPEKKNKSVYFFLLLARLINIMVRVVELAS
jgi:hypothetical protein